MSSRTAPRRRSAVTVVALVGAATLTGSLLSAAAADPLPASAAGPEQLAPAPAAPAVAATAADAGPADLLAAATAPAPIAAAATLAPAVAAPALARTGTTTTTRPVQRAASRAARTPTKVVPLSGYRLSSRYGQRGSMWSSGRHTGLDFAAPAGRPVRSVSPGVVTRAGWHGPYGKSVTVRYGRYEYLYAHLSAIAVTKGQRVAARTRLGKVGSTGNSTGPHLHLEVRKAGSRINPAVHLWGRRR